LEPAGWIVAVNTVFFDRGANDLPQQRFGDEARFGMMSRRCREWTPMAANEMFAFALVKSRGTSQVLQNLESRFRPFLARFVFNLQKVIGSDHFPHVSHGSTQLLFAEFSRENPE
jgi:hypothetical protein